MIKMRKLKFVLAITLILVMTGCGEWNQDPLAGKGGKFADPRPTPEKPDLSKPVPSDSVRIVAPDFVSFEEGKLYDFRVSGRALLEGYSVAIEIENLNEFPGASYDPAKQIFSWQPPSGWVDAKAGGNIYVDFALSVRALATKDEQPVLYGVRKIPLRVSRDFAAPEILRVDRRYTSQREGTSSTLFVNVRDRDAVVKDRSTWPRLMIDSMSNQKSLAGLLRVENIEHVNNDEFRLILALDLRERELTGSVDTYYAALRAVSRFGKLSTVRELNTDIYTSFSTPVTTWTEDLQIKASETVSQKFLIMDPKQEAVMSLMRTHRLPLGATLECLPLNTNRSVLNCTFTWTPPETAVGEHAFNAYMEMRNKDARDVIQGLGTIYLRAIVLPKGV